MVELFLLVMPPQYTYTDVSVLVHDDGAEFVHHVLALLVGPAGLVISGLKETNTYFYIMSNTTVPLELSSLELIEEHYTILYFNRKYFVFWLFVN